MPDIPTGVFFWGSGRETCERQRQQLHQAVDRLIEEASGLQQPDHSDSEQAAREARDAREVAQRRLRTRVAWLANAFGVLIDPAVLTWSRERPTEPGFYWLRFDGLGRDGRDLYTVARLMHGDLFFVGTERQGTDLVSAFAGPIPRPA